KTNPFFILLPSEELPVDLIFRKTSTLMVCEKFLSVYIFTNGKQQNYTIIYYYIRNNATPIFVIAVTEILFHFSN
ncbi:MAG: hypothetical protein NTU73_03210, partial [Ignavibacteriae bacterium]|nr:hypothetical protein [Ignavibacteriota bacterium]